MGYEKEAFGNILMYNKVYEELKLWDWKQFFFFNLMPYWPQLLTVDEIIPLPVDLHWTKQEGEQKQNTAQSQIDLKKKKKVNANTYLKLNCCEGS